MTDGKAFLAFVNKQRLNKTKLAANLGMSKQNLYQLFRSKEFQEDTIKNIEKATGEKWSQIKTVNIVVNVPHETQAEDPTNVYKAGSENRVSLEKSIENLTQNELGTTAIIKTLADNQTRHTAIIERLVSLLEQQAGKPLPLTLPPVGTLGTKNINPRKQKKPAQE